jgi:hypothetical protein
MRNTEKLDEKAKVEPKPYRKPTLVKGPMLGSITAQATVTGGGIPSDA